MKKLTFILLMLVTVPVFSQSKLSVGLSHGILKHEIGLSFAELKINDFGLYLNSKFGVSNDIVSDDVVSSVDRFGFNAGLTYGFGNRLFSYFSMGFERRLGKIESDQVVFLQNNDIVGNMSVGVVLVVNDCLGLSVGFDKSTNEAVKRENVTAGVSVFF